MAQRLPCSLSGDSIEAVHVAGAEINSFMMPPVRRPRPWSQAMPVPATPQEFERRLGGGRTASGVGTKQAGREISGLRGRDRRRGDGKRPQGPGGRLRSGAAPGDDSSDHIIEVGVVVDPGLPRLIGRVRVGECHQREQRELDRVAAALELRHDGDARK